MRFIDDVVVERVGDDVVVLSPEGRAINLSADVAGSARRLLDDPSTLTDADTALLLATGVVEENQPSGLSRRAVVTGAAHWLWPKIDQTLLEITAEAAEERAILRAYALENPDDWRSRASLRHLEKQLLGHLAALGFTPSDRARIGLIEAKTGGKLEGLMRMRDEIRAGTWERKFD